MTYPNDEIPGITVPFDPPAKKEEVMPDQPEPLPGLPAIDCNGITFSPFMHDPSHRFIRGMTVADLVATLSALDPSTRVRVLREAIPESDWARITDEDDEAAQRFLEMSDEELDAAIVAAGGDPERHHRASQAMVRWTRKLAEMHGELTAARAEVERLKAALLKIRAEVRSSRPVGYLLATALEALESAGLNEPKPPGLVNYGMDTDE